MCAGGRAGVDQLFGLKTGTFFKGQQVSVGGYLVIGRAVEGPFVATKKETGQTAPEARKDPFAVRALDGLEALLAGLAIRRQINTSFSKLVHTCFLACTVPVTKKTYIVV